MVINLNLKEKQHDWIALLQQEVERHPMGVPQDMFLVMGEVLLLVFFRVICQMRI